MEPIIYIKAPQCIDITDPSVTFGDFLTIYCTDTKIQNKLNNLQFYTFPAGESAQVVVSVLKIMEMILTHYPDAQIENLGEGDFILSYDPPKTFAKAKEMIFTFFICLVAFFGGGYAIMAYNTDVGARELFTYLSMLFLGNAKSGVLYVAITYAIGLTVGMLLFFNHLGNKKLTQSPTPLEIQMRLYEKDISTTVIKDISRRGKNIDIPR